jgi:hypothetical protein
MELNNREISTLIWVGIALFLSLLKPQGRIALANVFTAFARPLIIRVLSIAGLWVGLCVFLMQRYGVWEWSNLKTTALWVMTFAFVTMFDVDKLGKPKFYSVLIRDILSATAIVVFIAEFTTFSLLGELVFVPFLILMGLIRAISNSKSEFHKIGKIFDVLAALVGGALLIYSIWWIAAEFSDFAQRDTALEFAVPIILSVLFIPFLFVFGLWANYERVFSSLNYSISDENLRCYARLRSFCAFRGDIEALDRWRNLLNRVQPTTRNCVNESIAAIKSAKCREKASLPIDPQEGWSPYLAKDFLKEEGLATSAYQDIGDGEWSCSSNLMDIDDGLLPNRLGYFILGDISAAKRLRLKLYVNNPSMAGQSEARFCEVATKLLEAAGVKDKTCLLELPIDSGRRDSDAGPYAVKLSREDWQGGIQGGYDRVLTIRMKAFEATDN